MSVEQVTFVVPSSPADRQKILDAFNEVKGWYIEIDARKTLIKEKIAALSEEYKIPKRQLAKSAKTYYKDSYSKEARETDDFQALYETITNQTALTT